MKLDFRFADEDDAADLDVFVNECHTVESQEGSAFQFRKAVPRLSLEEISSDLNSVAIKWIVLETPVPEERIVGAARFVIRQKVSMVDIMCCDQQSSVDVLGFLLNKLEHIAFSHGMEKVVVGIPQWRSDLESILLRSEYLDQSGYIWPEDKSSMLLKPTMIVEYHKNLAPSVGSNVVQAPHSYEPTSSAYHDGSLLDKMESVSAEEVSFGEAKPGMYYNEDGVLCLDFDDDAVTATESTQGQSNSTEEQMETLIESLFSALHKSFDNNTL